ncbi:MAG TPA: PPOX class F420-dependent oxidoreductase [Thermomicrobiales bacterium]
MPQGPVPERFHDLLNSKTLAHLSTIGPRGEPQVNPVWFLWDGEHILLSIRPVTQKYRNLRRDPRLAISLSDPARPERHLEIRGEVVDWTLFRDLTFVNQLAHKYTGADYTRGVPGEERYRVTVRIDSWHSCED